MTPTIIHVPHPTLRKKAVELDISNQPALEKEFHELKKQLLLQHDPPGVGLASPQLDSSVKAFAIYLPPEDSPDEDPVLKMYINPKIEKSIGSRVFVDESGEQVLEGCLSIPKLYGPVPRFETIEISGWMLQEQPDGSLEKTRVDTAIKGYESRVFQHELDHLYGVLFTDYTLELGLPLYEQHGTKFKPISRSVITWGNG